MANISKKDIVRLLDTIAIYMELKGENPFKVQAFQRAATVLDQDPRRLAEIENFQELPGIGKGTTAIIEEYISTGKSTVLDQLKKEVPVGLVFLLQIPGLGAKTIARLYQQLNIKNADDLRRACVDGKVRKLKGFGEKKEKNILEAIDRIAQSPNRLPLAEILPVAERIETELGKLRYLDRFSRAGSLRRMKETVKDLDFVISTEEPEKVKEQIIQLPDIKEVINEGNTKITCLIDYGREVSVDFCIVGPEEFATALHHFTGSKEHNVRLRQIAKERKKKINEYGVENMVTGETFTFQSETEFFHHFQLPFIPPELREDGREIERIHFINELIDLDKIKGDLHMHTDWSDGANSLDEMVEKARKLGYEYIAITDHSQSLKIANGLTPDRLRQQQENIRSLNYRFSDITILSGAEVDILPDGTLDYPDEILAGLDIVIASIHSAFTQSEEQIMKRLEKACLNPYVNIIAHPTGRIIGKREGYSVNMDRLIRLAKKTGTILELNASPKRLDLKRDFLMQAEQAGAKISINTDSHQLKSLNNMDIGVKYARKAWLNKKTVINCLPINELVKLFEKQRSQN